MIEQFTQELVQWIGNIPPAGIYGIFLLIAYVENVAPPIPGDLLVAFGGYLAARGTVGFAELLFITTAASVVGFMTMYWLGSHWGTQILEKNEKFWLMRLIPLKYITRARSWMHRWGQGVILANRFLPGTRSVIALTAGISHNRISYTIISSTISSLLWNFILLGFGWVVHENWRMIGEYLNLYSRTIIALILLIIAIRIGWKYFKKGKKDH